MSMNERINYGWDRVVISTGSWDKRAGVRPLMELFLYRMKVKRDMCKNSKSYTATSDCHIIFYFNMYLTWIKNKNDQYL